MKNRNGNTNLRTLLELQTQLKEEADETKHYIRIKQTREKQNRKEFLNSLKTKSPNSPTKKSIKAIKLQSQRAQ